MRNELAVFATFAGFLQASVDGTSVGGDASLYAFQRDWVERSDEPGDHELAAFYEDHGLRDSLDHKVFDYRPGLMFVMQGWQQFGVFLSSFAKVAHGSELASQAGLDGLLRRSGFTSAVFGRD